GTLPVRIMNQTSVKLDDIDYARVFPWTRLFRAFWIAVDLRKLLLAAIALLLLSGGWWVADSIPGVPQNVSGWPWRWSLVYDIGPDGTPLAEVNVFLNNPWLAMLRWGSNWQVVLMPMKVLLAPAVRLFQADATWTELAYHVTRFLWALVVWSLFVGA